MPTENVPRPPIKIPLALLYVSPSISLSLYLSLYLSISLSVYLSIYLSIFIGPVRVFLPLGFYELIYLSVIPDPPRRIMYARRGLPAGTDASAPV